MRRTRLYVHFSVLLLIVFLVSCSTPGKSVLRWDKLTPKGKAAVALGIYNDAYDSYLVDVNRPNLSDRSKQLLREKKKLLRSLYSVLQTYTKYVNDGVVPPDKTEQMLLYLLSQVSAK